MLVAKLTLGALAMGDRWFGGQTKSPWDPENARPGLERLVGRAGLGRGGGARAVRHRHRDARLDHVAGEPLRRHRPAADVRPGQPLRGDGPELDHGQDRPALPRRPRTAPSSSTPSTARTGGTTTVLDVPFDWDAGRDVRKLRVGYLKCDIEREIPDDPKNPDRVRRMKEAQAFNKAALEVIRALGVKPVPVELPEAGLGTDGLPADDGGRGRLRRPGPERASSI